MEEIRMRIAGTLYNDCVNGPGWRVSVFCSGCDVCCKGCHNKEYQDFNYGEPLDDSYIDGLIEELSDNRYEGISLLGGEPFAKKNIDGMILIAERVREKFGRNKNIWIWSGHYLKELTRIGRRSLLKENREYHRKIMKLLKLCDVLIDGPFILKERDITLAFRGSKNQNIVYLRNRRWK